MNNKENQNPMENQINPNHTDEKVSVKSKLNWKFCPVCGSSLPKVEKLRFCIKCGTNLDYLKEHKRISPAEVIHPYKTPSLYPQYISPIISYGPEKISDEDITDIKKHKLWRTTVSFSLPLGAFLLMDFIVAGFIAIFLFFISSFNQDIIYDLMSSTNFIIVGMLFELIFIIVPVMYVGKYLQNPSLKNRLGLLGFTAKGYDKIKIVKEILLGLGFAVIGMFLVFSVSIIVEIILELTFGIEIVRNVSGTTTDVELFVSSADIISIILLAIVMILVIGTSEEILFRGFMQKGLVRTLGTKWGIIITAIVFSLIHLIGIFLIILDPITLLVAFILSFLPYFAISLMLGYLYYWRHENLIAVMVTHGFYDALTIILAFFLYGFF